jgi:hypothetical protein
MPTKIATRVATEGRDIAPKPFAVVDNFAGLRRRIREDKWCEFMLSLETISSESSGGQLRFSSLGQLELAARARQTLGPSDIIEREAMYLDTCEW